MKKKSERKGIDDLLGAGGKSEVLSPAESAALVAGLQQHKPTGVPHSWVPFPVGLLPPVLSALVRTAAENIGCDTALVALPALATAAGCIGNSRAVQLKTTWTEPCCLWTMVVAESGSQKSPASAAAVHPLTEYQMRIYAEHDAETARYREDLERHKTMPKQDRGKAPDAPFPPHTYITGDVTIEALGEILRCNPRGILVARDELDGWFQGLTRYKGGSGTDRPQWLELHCAGNLIVERLSREQGRLAVPRALASITGTIQPAILARAFDADSYHSGLAARFLLAMPPRSRRVWRDDAGPCDVAEQYKRLLRSLLALTLSDVKQRQPRILRLSPDANAAWAAFYNEWAEKQHLATGEQTAALAKLEAYAARLMMVHHVVSRVAREPGIDGVDLHPVEVCSADAGIRLVRWFAHEAMRVYATLGESAAERETRYLMELIEKNGGTITARELQRSNGKRFPESAAAERALDALAEAGFGKWQEPPSSSKGGQPARRFNLHARGNHTSDT